MTRLMNKTLIEAYNESNKNKDEFFKIAYKTSGIRKQAFKSGLFKDFIETKVWK